MEPTTAGKCRTQLTLTPIRYGGETVKSLSTYVAYAEYVMNEVTSLNDIPIVGDFLMG
jgi:hypothetical protein